MAAMLTTCSNVLYNNDDEFSLCSLFTKDLQERWSVDDEGDVSDLLNVAMSSIGSIATSEPELGPAFDGRPTPTNIIAANIYELLCEEMWCYIESDEWKDHFNTYCENNKIVLDVGGPSYANYHRVKEGK